MNVADDSTDIGRRSALGRLATAAALAGAAPLLASAMTASGKATAPASGGRLKQSLSRWTSKAPLPELCKRLKAIGFTGVDLLYADEWAVVADNGMTVSMGYPAKRTTSSPWASTIPLTTPRSSRRSRPRFRWRSVPA